MIVACQCPWTLCSVQIQAQRCRKWNTTCLSCNLCKPKKQANNNSWNQSRNIYPTAADASRPPLLSPLLPTDVNLLGGRSNICHPATKLPFLQTALRDNHGSFLEVLSLPWFPNSPSRFVYLWRTPCECSCTGSPALQRPFPDRWCIMSCPVWWPRPSPLWTNTRNIQLSRLNYGRRKKL